METLQERMWKMVAKNYVHRANWGLVAAIVVCVWTIVFSIKTELGLNYFIMFLLSVFTGVVTYAAYEGRARPIAGLVFPFYIGYCLVFTHWYIFNPSKDWVGVYTENGSAIVRFYAHEPWVTRYQPHEWKTGKFFKTKETVNVQKYVEFDDVDVIVSLSVSLTPTTKKALENIDRLLLDTTKQDLSVVRESIREILTRTVREIAADKEFEQVFLLLDRTFKIAHAQHDLHATKLKILRGALARRLQEDIRSISAETMLYDMVDTSINMQVYDANNPPAAR